MSEETKLYEIGYHLLPMLAEESLASEAQALRDVVEKHGGAIQSAETPKSRQLAYAIRKKIANKYSDFTQSYFGTVTFRAPAEAAPAIKADLDKIENVLRFMLIETHPYEAPVRRMPQGESDAPKDAPAPEKPVEEKAEKPKLTAEQMDKEVDELIAETV